MNMKATSCVSRVDVYLPMRAKIQVKLGDKVKGGETVIASFD